MNYQLVAPDGTPLRKHTQRAMKKEIAAPQLTGVRSLMQEAIAPGLTPARLAGILRAVEEGDNLRDYLTLAEEMEEREFHYISVLGVRKRALQGLDIQIEAGTDTNSKEIADAVRELCDTPNFIDMIGDLADAIGKGFSVVEIIWHTAASRWTPAEFIHRDPRFFVFDRITRRQIRLAEDGNPDGVVLPDYKFIRHVPRLKSGIPIRCGLAKPAAWAFIFKSYTLKDWAAFAEVYGMPIRIGKYGPQATDEDKRKLLTAVRNIGTDAAAVIPESMMIEFVEAGRGVARSSGSVFGEFAEYLDKQISKLVLGQTMTTDDGSSLAQAKVHEEVRMDVLAADARQLETTINRDLIRPFIDLNFGPQKHYPRFTLPVAEAEDLTALATNLSKLVPLGFRVAETEVRDRFGFSDPDEGVPVLGGKGAQSYSEDPEPQMASDNEPDPDSKPPKGTSTSARMAASATARPVSRETARKKKNHTCCGTAANASQAEEDEIDALQGGALDDWQEVTDPLLSPIRKLIGEVSNYDDFLARLPEVFSQMDAGRLIETLAASMAIAKGLGDARPQHS